MGRYRLERRIGAGAMGSVWEALQEDLGRRVALKLLHVSVSSDSTAVARFAREAGIAAALRHPSIVPVTDYGVHEGVPYLVMDLLDGAPLDQVLKDEGPLSAQRTAELTTQILDALSTAHASAVLHRDIKPENIFIIRTAAGELARVLDFGIARVLDAASDGGSDVGGKGGLTKTGDLVGTPAFMAPERIRGGVGDFRSDLYSVGVLMYEALSGQQAFGDKSTHQTLLAVLDTVPAPLATLREDLDEALVAIVQRAMAKDPRHRFRNAREMMEALAPFTRPPEPEAAHHQKTPSTFAPPPARTDGDEGAAEPGRLAGMFRLGAGLLMVGAYQFVAVPALRTVGLSPLRLGAFVVLASAIFLVLTGIVEVALDRRFRDLDWTRGVRWMVRTGIVLSALFGAWHMVRPPDLAASATSQLESLIEDLTGQFESR